MATFFRSSQVWAVEYQHDGRTRRWLKALPLGTDAERAVRAMLADLYGDHARLVALRPATEREDQEFRRGQAPRNAYCPTGKAPIGEVTPPTTVPAGSSHADREGG
jgi:hypothetical protein